MKNHIIASASLLVPFCVTQAQAQAQPNDARGQAAAASQPSVGLSDIVVTAQRRSEPLQRAAVAVDVVSSASLIGAGVTKATDLGALVPALQVSTAGGSTTSFYLRGVGGFAANSYTDSAVALNYDGVYVARPAASSGLFYDVSRVEVLKGPQGTLYGRNATGGAVNVLPVHPELGRTSGFADISYGNYDAVNFQGAINLPLSDTTAFRLAGMVVNRKGYLSDGTDDDKGWAIRPQFLYEPSDALSIRIAADYFKQNGKGTGGTFVANTSYDPGTGKYAITPSGLAPSVGGYDPRSAPFLATTFSGLSGRTLGPLLGSPFLDNQTWGVNAELNWKTGLGTLTVVPAYRRFDENVLQAAGGFANYTRDRDSQFSIEARLASDTAKPLSWIVGGYYFDDKVNSPDFRVTMQVLDSFQKYALTTRSYAGFGRLTFKASDTFRLVAGGRYTDDHKTMSGTADVMVDACTAFTGCPGAPLLPFASSVSNTVSQLGLLLVAPGSANSPNIYIQPGNPAAANTIFPQGTTALAQARTDGRFTYHLGAEWDVAPRSLLYASYDTGFRSGGFAFSTFKPSFGPEAIRAWTIGSKNRFFNNRLQLNAEAFLWKYDDQQVSHLGPDPQLGSTFYTENIGRSTNKGFELELQYQPVKTTRLSADIQYLDATLNAFAYTSPAVSNGNPSPAPLTGCAVTSPASFAPGSTYLIDCSGKRAFQSPAWTINLAAEQTVHLGQYDLVANLSTHHQTSSLVGFEFLSAQTQGAYWMTNAALTIKPDAWSWSLTAYINNIENGRRATLSYLNSPTSTLSDVYSAPRTYGVRLGYQF